MEDHAKHTSYSPSLKIFFEDTERTYSFLLSYFTVPHNNFMEPWAQLYTAETVHYFKDKRDLHNNISLCLRNSNNVGQMHFVFRFVFKPSKHPLGTWVKHVG